MRVLRDHQGGPGSGGVGRRLTPSGSRITKLQRARIDQGGAPATHRNAGGAEMGVVLVARNLVDDIMDVVHDGREVDARVTDADAEGVAHAGSGPPANTRHALWPPNPNDVVIPSRTFTARPTLGT